MPRDDKKEWNFQDNGVWNKNVFRLDFAEILKDSRGERPR